MFSNQVAEILPRVKPCWTSPLITTYSRVAMEPTRDRSILDLCFTNNSAFVISVTVKPGISDQIGRTLRKFTQLKRNKRFDYFIMLVWVQGSLLHIAAGSHPVQEVWGSQDSLYRGQIHKLLQCCREPYQQIPLVITIQKKYSLTYLRRTVS